MLQRGKIVNLTFASQKIDNAISSFNGECFTRKEICKITGVNDIDVGFFLFRKTKKGLLEKLKPGYYKKISSGDLINRRSAAFVATKVWRILSQSEKPLTHREISEIIEKETGLNTYSSIGKLLFDWYYKKVLDKIGGKRPYEYKIKQGYNRKNRPSAGHVII